MARMPRARTVSSMALDVPMPTLVPVRVDPHVQLALFRATHLASYRFVHGVRWKYLACGAGPEALLMLPGAPGLSETAFQQIPLFERRFRVIAPDLPAAVTTLAGLVEGLTAILDTEGIARAHVLGVSYSGILAQELARRHPERVERLVLSHARMPAREAAGRYLLAGNLLLALPLPVLRLVLRPMRLLLPREVQIHRAFWKSYYTEIVDRLTRADYASRMRVWMDVCRQARQAPDEPFYWRGETLVIEADDDPLIPPRERNALRLRYPTAQVHTFSGTKHSAWIARQDEYVCLIERFMHKEEAGGENV